ncbi:MAG: hypothetical protein KAU84_01910 [Thermoplasmatales archaeon]|nr:hypothetical protein [Thermoplasmatales archaeon]
MKHPLATVYNGSLARFIFDISTRSFDSLTFFSNISKNPSGKELPPATTTGNATFGGAIFASLLFRFCSMYVINAL